MAKTSEPVLVFNDGDFRVDPGICDNPTITFTFKSAAKMNAFFTGKMVMPKIKGIMKVGLFLKVFRLILSLKILMPNARPKDSEKKRLKVKMAFYMIISALSQYNKGGDPEMVRWTKKQPERIYQISVEEGIAAYLRVRAGRTKAGRGVYAKRRPFVRLNFNGVDGAFPVIMKDVGMIEAVKKGYLRIEGSPEYGGNLSDFMARIQALVT
ncbi:MAG: hypothetical protein DDT31_00964 [Syntrophomonadaceae bacterium]|nr:hypothetical protein [Bacillota bacterium]